MTDNIFDFARTSQALGSLSETVIRLDAALKNKRQRIADTLQEQRLRLQDKDKRLEELRAASANVLDNIDGIIGRLDEILENNGTGNDND